MATIGYRPDQSVVDMIDELCVEKMWSRNKVVSHIVKQYFDKPAKTEVAVVSKKPAKRFVKPTLMEVQQEFQNKGSYTCLDDGDSFFNHYESNGWKVGKNSMKNWKSTVAQWHKRNKEDKNEKAKSNGITSGPTVTALDDNF